MRGGPATSRGRMLFFIGLIAALLLQSRFVYQLKSILTTGNGQQAMKTNETHAAVTRNVSESSPSGGVVVWMVQGKASDHAKWNSRFGQASPIDQRRTKLLYHSYDKPCPGCIFLANTTWLTGNNLLIQHAWNMPNVKFFVRTDNDLIMNCTQHPSPKRDENSCWHSFNTRLLDYNETSAYPAQVLSPKTWWDPLDESDSYQSCPDITLLALRPDAVPLQYPMATLHQNIGWNLFIHAQWHLIDRCAPTSIYTMADYRLSNPTHADYPQEYTEQADALIHDILNRDYSTVLNQNESWPLQTPASRIPHRCNVSTTSPDFSDAHCLQELKLRFDSWRDTW